MAWGLTRRTRRKFDFHTGEIGSKDRIPEFLARAKDKNDPFKLMGFGHRVYRNIDPRAKEMKKLALDCIAPRTNQISRHSLLTG